MTSQTGLQINTMHILSNISRIKSNSPMKIGYLMEYSMRNIFLEKTYTKCGGEAATTDKIFEKKI